MSKPLKDTYWTGVKAALPIALIGSPTKIPRGIIEGGIENIVGKRKFKLGEVSKKGLSRGIAQAVSAAVPAAFTAPLFAKSIQKVQKSKTPMEKAKGFGYLMGSGAVYAGIKGAIERPLEYMMLGKKKGLKRVALGSAVGKTLIGAAGAATVGASIAAGRKKKRGTIYAAAAGGILGGLKGFTEALSERKIGKQKISIPGRMAGKAVSGVIGAVILAETVDRALKAMAKKGK